MVSNFAVPNIFTEEKEVVPGTGFEPAWFFDRLILSQLRLPFRHPGARCAVFPLSRRERRIFS